MALFILLLFTCTFISRFKCSEDPQLKDVISISPVEKQLSRRVDDTLNLTCTVTSGNDSNLNKFKITWHTPYYNRNSKNRVSNIKDHNRLTLMVHSLQESDSGDYKCQAVADDEDQTQLQQVIRVNVKQKKSYCLENMFLCTTSGNCIPKRYMCDGVPDCKSGEDEAEKHCGPNACEGKLKCEGERCIPIYWCCDDYMDPNCTVKIKPPCCKQLATGDMDTDPGFPPSDQQRFNDMGFLQTTIYTVIGCAMAFMFIVTILVIAICRVHMRRSLLSRCSGVRGGAGGFPGRTGMRGPHHHHAMQHMPLYDLDVFLNRSSFPSDLSPHSGLLVTYNINNGVQFVGRPVDPPPYCEIVASPPREGPPPPYASRESLLRPVTSACGSNVVREDPDADESPAEEGDSLLGSIHREDGAPIIRQSNNTLRVTVINAPVGSDFLDMTRVNHHSGASHLPDDVNVSDDSLASPESSSRYTDIPSPNEDTPPNNLLNCVIVDNRANDSRTTEISNENTVNNLNCNEIRPLLSENLAASPKAHQPEDLREDPLCASLDPTSQSLNKLTFNLLRGTPLRSHIPSVEENSSFNIHETRDNPIGRLRESFIGLREAAGDMDCSESVKSSDNLTTAEGALNSATQCADSLEGSGNVDSTDINRTQPDGYKE